MSSAIGFLLSRPSAMSSGIRGGDFMYWVGAFCFVSWHVGCVVAPLFLVFLFLFVLGWRDFAAPIVVAA